MPKRNIATSSVNSKKRNRAEMHNEEKNTLAVKVRQRTIEVDVWVDKHKPKNKNELAVHKKKVLEVEMWFKNHIEKSNPKNASILLLTGPAGAGKTATIQTLAKEMHLEVQEWINPLTDVYQNDITPDYNSRAGQAYQSQTTLFSDFLSRANRYQTLQLFGEASYKQKVIIIEELPHTFLREPQQLHAILQKYKKTGRSPLVFIISDIARGDSVVRKLFSKDIQIALDVQEISFNPVAPTSMCKVLTSIATIETAKGVSTLHVPCKTTIQALAEASTGDIRGAINALQFACLKDSNTSKSWFDLERRPKNQTKRKTTKQGKQGSKLGKRKSEEEIDGKSLAAIGGRDTSMFLFRALGKILYCKRVEPNADDDNPSLPSHLQHHDRDKLKFNPEDVINQTQISSDMFNLYLHQNYLEFYNRIDDVVRGSEYLSDADLLSCNWSHRSILSEYSSCIAARGVVHCNSTRSRHNTCTGSLGWKPLHKPQWWQVAKQNRNNAYSAKALFHTYCSTPVELHTQFLPFLSRIKLPLHSPGQMSLLQELNSFSTSTRSRFERLDEKDVENTEVEDSASQMSAVQESSTESVIKSSLYDNDIDIGDFDDDNLIDDFYDDNDWGNSFSDP
ncbi:cell cycle checkpoint protein RAD17-like isoform X2 [Antedon mediterranea]